jgi:hypothetical protein
MLSDVNPALKPNFTGFLAVAADLQALDFINVLIITVQ